ncbi:Cobyric acid synthase [Granulicella sibirica]|uniref:Cobyric acid synthase n=2 Tax=Granulicella sibirica TaxID=2479048 RepID=A0A4Q0T4I2_9BACT|nr:Cobyric acid synthase [Granulicella sibirica]
MILGTSSHVGKSLLVTALCRIFHQHGISVAPFKSQNMSLNSAATPDGLEIGRAQALQAEAAGIPARVEMNPILIKPTGDMSSQVVVRGKIWGRVTARDYHQRRVEELMPIVRESWETLAREHEVIILEGAGSPAEINLKQHDIVNMRMAEMADAHCILVGDIDRGGVFASLLGTVELLDAEERARIQAFAINKFRGDIALLQPGIEMMEQRLNKPCIGVVPHLPNLLLEEEDSLGLDRTDRIPWPQDSTPDRLLRIAVVALPTFSNFTDFDALATEPSVSLRFTQTPDVLRTADIIILPGSKQTVDDLQWLRETNLADIITTHAQTSLITGICGGMQMLGETIADPEGIERQGTHPGLSLLPIQTTMQPTKLTRLTTGTLTTETLFNQPIPHTTIEGYEIHVGETTRFANAQPFATFTGLNEDGCISPNTRIFGTYLHGLFDDDAFRHTFLRAARAFHHLTEPTTLTPWKQRREESLNRLAAAVEDSWDMPTIFGWLNLPYKRAASE